jgi:uncharacterized repeat protein (TIGR04076 family)
MTEHGKLDFGIELSKPMTRDEYHAYWDRLARVEIRMIGKYGECHHNLGDVFYYETPYQRPEGVCTALLHVIDLYVWRAAMGFPSWYEEDPRVHRIHCPDHTGTVWAVRRVESTKDTKP